MIVENQKNLAEWLEYLLNIHETGEIDLGLDRVSKVRQNMNLDVRCPLIVVGGTNGKGSVCAFLTHIYKEAGYKVGTFISPHLLRYNERIQINGMPVLDQIIIDSFEEIEASRGDISLTFFEVNTLAAVDIFNKEKVDVVILEVGLGGRLDAVNIFDSDISVITNIDLDHQEYLGITRESIGYEKAGIMRSHKPVVIGEYGIPDSVIHYAQEIKALPLVFRQDFHAEILNQQWSYWFHPQEQQAFKSHQRYALPIPSLRGSFQIGNASSALTVVECLQQQLPTDIGSIKKALVLVTHPGRFQVMPGRPMVILDVGHNLHAMINLKHHVQLLPYARKKRAVFSMLQDKDMDQTIDLLKEEFDEWYIAPLKTKRTRNINEMKKIFNKYHLNNINLFDSIAQAYKQALSDSEESDRIIVFGSFYTVAEVLEKLEN